MFMVVLSLANFTPTARARHTPGHRGVTPCRWDPLVSGLRPADAAQRGPPLTLNQFALDSTVRCSHRCIKPTTPLSLRFAEISSTGYTDHAGICRRIVIVDLNRISDFEGQGSGVASRGNSRRRGPAAQGLAVASTRFTRGKPRQAVRTSHIHPTPPYLSAPADRLLCDPRAV